jgi:4-hydroxybenzoate polyprenyltransferase
VGQDEDVMHKDDRAHETERDRDLISGAIDETAWLAVLVLVALGLAAVVVAVLD